MIWTPIVGRGFAVSEFSDYVSSLKFNGWTPKFAVVHNTSAPDGKLYRDWQTRKGWTGEQWLRNLESYYRGLGWQAGPHLFVASDKIWAFTPLTGHGTHTPSWNSFTWGIETVGEFEVEPFDNGVRTNLVAALGILHARVGLDPADYKLGVSGLHFHKEDKATTHRTCPGHNVIKADLIADVQAYMTAANGGEHVHVPVSVHEAPTEFLSTIEMTSVAWLQAALIKIGLLPPGSDDDDLGPKTRAATEAFQRISKLVVDGVAGPLTRIALKKAVS